MARKKKKPKNNPEVPEGFCRRPDRDVPELVCGYPLPCPWHTATIDTTSEPATVTVPVTGVKPLDRKKLEALKDIGRALTEESAE